MMMMMMMMNLLHEVKIYWFAVQQGNALPTILNIWFQ
jgi:hypothetical protein